MPPLRLTNSIIEKSCELRAYGGSDSACARHAGVTVQTFGRWLHFGEMIYDWLQNGCEFDPPEVYRTWRKDAVVVQEKLKREFEHTGNKLSKEHRAYLKLWSKMSEATDMFISECHQTIDRAKNTDPVWALRGLRWFLPYDYREPAEVVEAEKAEAEQGNEIIPNLPYLPADVIAPSFVNVYRDCRDRRHMEYLLEGGRGSTKSSFTSLVIIYLLVNHPGIHILAMRQVAETLRNSVYSQFIWAISELGLSSEFKYTVSPLEITYKPTGQKIFFYGADEPEKIKSIKPTFGHIGILWLEELDQFRGPEAVRKIEQSVLRGGDEAWEFKTYNPPKTAANWVNKYAQVPKANQYHHHSTYLDVPPEWLGQTFIDEAEHLQAVNPTAYKHEYLGEVTGTGGLVFENVRLRKITDEEIAQFDHILMGNDWGYYPDPWQWVKCHYDAARLTLYIFDELRMWKASNHDTYDELIRKGVQPGDLLIADSAEPKSVADYQAYGLNCRGAEKGPESVKYSMKWLQSLAAIVIDNERCPYSAEEFLNYELEQDRDGNFISEYPDRDNHAIDAARYATNLIWRRRGQ